MERGRYGKEETWCGCVEEVSTSVNLINAPTPLDGLYVSFFLAEIGIRPALSCLLNDVVMDYAVLFLLCYE